MASLARVRERMEVRGSDGEAVGTVDRVEGDSIKLTRTDPLGDGYHHWVPADWVERVEGDTVRLSLPAQQARRDWLDSAPTAGL